MGLQQKAAKLTRNKDLLIELPDEILSTIISMLTMTEAVRTSVLSKRWRCIWTSHADLWFDSANVLGNTVYSTSTSNCLPELDRKLQRCAFIERVNQFMHLRCKGTKIDSFVVHFHLGMDSTSHIDRWLSYAITKGVVNVDLDLSESSSFMVDPAFSTALEKYEFPCWLLTAAGKSCSLKHLRLASCSLSAPSAFNGLTSLVTIQLQGVIIIDQQLERLLSSCLFLEELSLHQCNDLVNLTLAGPSLRLKILDVEDCFRLQKMELCAKNLVSFEYTGHLITFYFKNVPRLSEAFLNFNGESKVDGTVYALTRFGNDLPQLETLNIVSVLAMKILELPETVPKFTNIKQLVLTVFPFEDDDKLCWISYVLEAFPSLHKLQLNLFCPVFIKPPKEMKRVLPKCPHLHLNELEINGVYGSHHEVELLKYLLDNLIFLKVLVISSNQKAYRGLNNWFYEEAISCYKLRLKTLSKSLRAVVPDTVHLQIHCC